MEMFNRPLISIAPMIDVSYTHFRYFIRLLTRQATIYTQMLHHNAISNNHKMLLPFHPAQHPVVLQLGGCDPVKLADAAQLGVKYGYDQINLNVGCPSPRVQSGSFGACLMKQPELVAQCMREVSQRVKGTACTVKCRLGVDDFDSYEFAKNFVQEVSKQGHVQHFIIHARKAFLKGLNPSQNRNVPPLMYDRVYKLQEDFPQLKFSINGGIRTLKDAHQILKTHQVYGCMMGRTAYENPYELVRVDQLIYGYDDKPVPSREQILYKYADYIDHVQSGGYFNETGPEEGKQEVTSIKHHYVNPSVLVKPIINMYHGQRNCAKFRQMLSNVKQQKIESLGDLIREAAQFMKGKQKQGKQEKQEKEKEQMEQMKAQTNV